VRSAPVVEPRRLALGACVVAAVLAFASGVLAQAGDLVILRNGGRLRGTVEVYEPGTRVVILLPDGSRRTLAGGEIERVQFEDAGAPAAPQPSPPPQQLEPSAPPPAEPSPPVAPTEPSSPPEPSPRASALESAPATGDALSGGDLERLESIVGPSAPTAAVPAFGDGHREDVPWNEVDPRTRSIYAPAGMLHLVVEGRCALALSYSGNYRDDGIRWGGDVAFGADLRVPSTLLHVRAAVVLGLQTHTAYSFDYPGFGGSLSREQGATGFGYVGARALAGVDATSWLTLRVGGEYGFEVLPVFDVLRIYGGPELDVAIRALDDRRLEIGLALAVQDRSHAEVQISNGAPTYNHAGTSWSPRLALTIAGVFL
jgi:hypothetical protein